MAFFEAVCLKLGSVFKLGRTAGFLTETKATRDFSLSVMAMIGINAGHESRA
jgi:hypothetical protein